MLFWSHVLSLLNEMIDRDVVARFPQKDFRLKQESSYNRASKSPEDTIGWFTNHDMNPKDTDTNFIRIEENDGMKEWVLMDHQGAGAIVRTWMPFRSTKNPKTDIIIKFYFDGAEEPTLEGNMLGLLDGTDLFPFPLSHKSLRSAVSFFPIPYAKSCKVTVTQRPFFYQFTFREYTAGTAIKTFTMEDYHKAEAQVKQVCETLLTTQTATEGGAVNLSATLGKNEEKSIALPEGTSAPISQTRKLRRLNSYSFSSAQNGIRWKANRLVSHWGFLWFRDWIESISGLVSNGCRRRNHVMPLGDALPEIRKSIGTQSG